MAVNKCHSPASRAWQEALPYFNKITLIKLLKIANLGLTRNGKVGYEIKVTGYGLYYYRLRITLATKCIYFRISEYICWVLQPIPSISTCNNILLDQHGNRITLRPKRSEI